MQIMFFLLHGPGIYFLFSGGEVFHFGTINTTGRSPSLSLSLPNKALPGTFEATFGRVCLSVNFGDVTVGFKVN